MVFILAGLHAVAPEDKLARRQEMIVATDAVDAFRARVSVELYDELTDEEIVEARRVVNDILTPVQQAQTAVVASPAKKKRKAA